MHLSSISDENLQILITESLNFKKGDFWYNPLSNTVFNQAPSNVLSKVYKDINWRNFISNYYSKYKIPSFSKMRYKYAIDSHEKKVIVNNTLFSYSTGYNGISKYTRKIGCTYNDFHLKNNLGEFKRCTNCNEKILYKDAFGNIRINSYKLNMVFCKQQCYWEGLRKGLYPEQSVETRQKMSNILKNKILNGEFTPCVTNSWCKSRIDILNIHARSSWEAGFKVLNPHMEFEKVRVPYNINNKTRTYIIDFVDEETKKLYEIKPSSKINDEINIIKANAAIEWAKHNGYTYTIIDESYFLENKETLLKLLHYYPQGVLIARRLYKVKLPEYLPPITHL